MVGLDAPPNSLDPGRRPTRAPWRFSISCTAGSSGRPPTAPRPGPCGGLGHPDPVTYRFRLRPAAFQGRTPGHRRRRGGDPRFARPPGVPGRAARRRAGVRRRRRIRASSRFTRASRRPRSSARPGSRSCLRRARRSPTTASARGRSVSRIAWPRHRRSARGADRRSRPRFPAPLHDLARQRRARPRTRARVMIDLWCRTASSRPAAVARAVRRGRVHAGCDVPLPGHQSAPPRAGGPARPACDRARDRPRAIVRWCSAVTRASRNGLFPPEHWSHADVPDLDYDPALARRLLDEAARERTRDAETSTVELRRRIGGWSARCSARRRHHRRRPPARVAKPLPATCGGSFDLFAPAWFGIEDPDQYYAILHSSMTPPRGSNCGGFADAEVDALTVEARGPIPREGAARALRARREIVQRATFRTCRCGGPTTSSSEQAARRVRAEPDGRPALTGRRPLDGGRAPVLTMLRYAALRRCSRSRHLLGVLVLVSAAALRAGRSGRRHARRGRERRRPRAAGRRAMGLRPSAVVAARGLRRRRGARRPRALIARRGGGHAARAALP